jgi:hypothetical protein
MKESTARLEGGLTGLRRIGTALNPRIDIGRRVFESLKLLKTKLSGKRVEKESDGALKIARYNLVLMDADGQVVWGREFDAGGAFDFRPGHRLYVCCEFTNRSSHEAEVAEYEIELAGEDGAVVSRFGESFGDAVVVAPGECRQFVGQWCL